MSTIVVVRKNGYAAIGADTLTTFGSTHESAEYIANHSKIIKLGSSYVASCGHASFGMVLTSAYHHMKVKCALDSPQTIFEFARVLHTTLKDEYFLNAGTDSDDHFESSRTSCLIANSHGIFGLYSKRSVQEYTKFYAFGSGNEFALGAMHAVYDTDLDAAAIARAGIEAAVAFDESSGLPMEIETVKLKASKK